MVFARALIFHMLKSPCEDMILGSLGQRSRSQWLFCKTMVSAHYLENYVAQSFYVYYDWS